MTRADFYREGYGEGAEWAEHDVANSYPYDATADELRGDARTALDSRNSAAGDLWAALIVGRARGYVDTLERTLTTGKEPR